MRSFVLLGFIVAACGGDGGSAVPNLIVQDEASDEVFLSLVDEVAQGNVTVSDVDAAQLQFPTDGSVLARAMPATFTWALPASRPSPRHGRITGQFVWLKLSGGGLGEEIHVVSIETTAWTPDAATWETISQANGEITATMTTAYVRDGIVTEGPYQPSETVGFTIGP